MSSMPRGPAVPIPQQGTADRYATISTTRCNQAGFIPAVTQRATFQTPPNRVFARGVSRGDPDPPALLVVRRVVDRGVVKVGAAERRPLRGRDAASLGRRGTMAEVGGDVDRAAAEA